MFPPNYAPAAVVTKALYLCCMKVTTIEHQKHRKTYPQENRDDQTDRTGNVTEDESKASLECIHTSSTTEQAYTLRKAPTIAARASPCWSDERDSKNRPEVPSRTLRQ